MESMASESNIADKQSYGYYGGWCLELRRAGTDEEWD